MPENHYKIVSLRHGSMWVLGSLTVSCPECSTKEKAVPMEVTISYEGGGEYRANCYCMECHCEVTMQRIDAEQLAAEQNEMIRD